MREVKYRHGVDEKYAAVFRHNNMRDDSFSLTWNGERLFE